MKRLLSTITFIAWAVLLTAADKPVATAADSLRRLLPTLTGAQKLDAYEAFVVSQEWTGDMEGTLAACDEWIAEASRQGAVQSEEQARLRKLTIIYNSENWPLLMPEAEQQRNWMEQHGCWDSYYKAWRDIIEAHSYSKRPQTALREAQHMQEHAQQHDNDMGMALAYQQMGVIYDNIDHAEAAKAFENSIRQMKDTPETENELLSDYYYLAQELDQMGEYARELAVCSEWRQRLDRMSREEPAEKSRMEVHYLENHLWNASALIGLGRLDEADEELTICTELNRQVNNDVYLAYQIHVHRAHLALKQGNIAAAVDYSDRFAPMMASDEWPLAQRLRGEILLKAGRNVEAANHYRQMYEQKDSTFTKDVRMQLDEFNTLFQLNEIRTKSQLERQRFVIGMAALVLAALLIFIFLRHRAAKRLEQKNRELTIANLRAEESSKMKTNFIQQISHEIRTPLNILSGFTQVITTPGMQMDDDTRQDINQRITENTNRITSLVNKMLELSEANSQTVIERGDDVTAAQIAAQAAEDASASNAQHVSFDLQLEPEVASTVLHTNLRYATRALTLLLGNALKFTKEGTVRLRCSESAPHAVGFTVEDTGIGIPPAEAEHIFEEFVQLDEYYDGTGIGLTVARSIARRLGGDIVLDTSYTGGARFTMTLPAGD